MATYLGRNVNLALLLIIIGVVVAMVGTTVFFQRSLQNRTSSLEDTSVTLSSCQAALASYQNRYAEAQQKVNETAQDIRRYDQLYEQKVGELQDSQSQLLETERQLEFERLQKERFQDFYEEQLQENRNLNSTIDGLRSTIRNLEDDIDELQAQLAACGG